MSVHDIHHHHGGPHPSWHPHGGGTSGWADQSSDFSCTPPLDRIETLAPTATTTTPPQGYAHHGVPASVLDPLPHFDHAASGPDVVAMPPPPHFVSNDSFFCCSDAEPITAATADTPPPPPNRVSPLGLASPIASSQDCLMINCTSEEDDDDAGAAVAALPPRAVDSLFHAPPEEFTPAPLHRFEWVVDDDLPLGSGDNIANPDDDDDDDDDDKERTPSSSPAHSPAASLGRGASGTVRRASLSLMATATATRTDALAAAPTSTTNTSTAFPESPAVMPSPGRPSTADVSAMPLPVMGAVAVAAWARDQAGPLAGTATACTDAPLDAAAFCPALSLRNSPSAPGCHRTHSSVVGAPSGQLVQSPSDSTSAGCLTPTWSPLGGAACRVPASAFRSPAAAAGGGGSSVFGGDAADNDNDDQQDSPMTSVPVAIKTIRENDATRVYAARCEEAFVRRYFAFIDDSGTTLEECAPHLVHVMSVSRNAAARETTVVMEQLPGTDVHDIPALAAVRELTTNAATAATPTNTSRPPSPSEVDAALRMVAGDVARGLRSLHEELRVVHRDVKPANLLLDHSGRVKVGDFGVSAVLPMSPETNTDTDHDASDDASGLPTDQLGTFGYMAPERLRGEAHGPASDVWSLGVTLLELALGRRPFGAAGSGTEGFWRTASAIGALEGASGGGGGDGARTASAAVEGALAECADRTRGVPRLRAAVPRLLAVGAGVGGGAGGGRVGRRSASELPSRRSLTSSDPHSNAPGFPIAAVAAHEPALEQRHASPNNHERAHHSEAFNSTAIACRLDPSSKLRFFQRLSTDNRGVALKAGVLLSPAQAESTSR